MDSDLKEKVLLNLRSVTQSVKGGVPVDRLQRDYRDLLGTTIPFKDLGYQSLEGFIRAIPHVISLTRGQNGQLMAQGVADSSTAHIVSLVSRQKPAPDTRNKKRGFRRPPPHIASRLASRYPTRTSPRYSTNNVTSSYRGSPAPSYPKPQSQPITRTQTPPPRPEPIKSYVPPKEPVSRKCEIAPRFLRLQRQQKSSCEAVEPPVAPRPAPVSRSNTSEVPQRAPRNLQTSSVPSTTDRNAQLSEALDSARTAHEFVEIYARMNDCVPVYHTKPVGQKKNKGFVSNLVIGDKTYQTYPDIKNTKHEAEELAANNAMNEIKESRAHMALLPETSHASAEDIQTLLYRIEEIVWEKPSGMFTNGIIREYETKFGERLPSCWLDLLKQCNSIDVDAIDVPYGKIPEGASFIVRPSKDLSSGNGTPSSTSSKSEVANEDLNSTLKNSLVKISLPKVDEIKLPDGNEWYVYISCVRDAMFARLLDYSDEFYALTKKMQEYYISKSCPVVDIFENQIYAITEDNPEIWHRAIALEIRDTEVSCYLVDEGESVTVKKENLQEMNPHFLTLPFQAILISLDGLEEYEQFIKPEYLENNVLGHTLVAEVKRWWSAPDFLLEHPGLHRMGYSVILFDTSGDDESDVNLNNWLKSTVLQSLACELPKESVSVCAFLSHVTPEGKIFLRLMHPEDNLLEYELEKLAPAFEAASLKGQKLDVNSLCVAKCSDDKWHRALVCRTLELEQVEIFLVDFGNYETVQKSNICDLELVNSQLTSVPYQATECELFDALPSPDAKWTNLATQKLKELMPTNQEIMVRVMYEGNEKSLPKVNLYKRNKDSDIISINQTLFSRPDLFQIPYQSCRKSMNENLWISRHLREKLS